MNKLFLVLTFLISASCAKAQFIAGLDEVALMGNWSTYAYAAGCDNQWSAFDGKRLSALHFEDNGISSITVQDSNFGGSHLIRYCGYIVSGTSTGKYTLHFIQQAESETWNYTTPQINFVITDFDGETMTLTSYDGKHGVVLKKNDSSAIDNTNANTPEADTTIYNLKGMVVKNPTAPGVYIQGNGKKIVK